MKWVQPKDEPGTRENKPVGSQKVHTRAHSGLPPYGVPLLPPIS